MHLPFNNPYFLPVVPAGDELDLSAHDARYHHGHFDPATMTCKTREAYEHGDLADVIAAEEWERAYKRNAEKRKRKEEAARERRENAGKPPAWVLSAPPCKIALDPQGRKIVACPYVKVNVKADGHLNKGIFHLQNEYAINDGKKIWFSKPKEYQRSKDVVWLSIKKKRGILDKQNPPQVLSDREDALPGSRPIHTADFSTNIVAQPPPPVKGSLEEISAAAKSWAGHTLRAKVAIIPYLKEIVAAATLDKHIPQSALDTEGHDKSRKLSWAGGLFHYTVRFSVAFSPDAPPVPYTAQMIAGENDKGERFFYDIVDIDDGSGWPQYFAACRAIRRSAVAQDSAASTPPIWKAAMPWL